MSDVTVKLVLGTLSVEVTGPQEYVDKKLEELVGRFVLSARRPSGPEVKTPEAGVPGDKQISPAEFLKRYSVSNQTDRALLLGYYLERMKNITSFTTAELSILGKDIKRPFGNISDVVAQLASRGLMMSAGDKEGKRAYSLTATGEEYVESMLQGN